MADDDRHDRGGDDLGVTVFAYFGREALRIVEAFGDAVGIEDHGGNDHRPRPRSASGLGYAGHGAAIEAHQLLLAVEARRGAKRERLGGKSHGSGLWRKAPSLGNPFGGKCCPLWKRLEQGELLAGAWGRRE